VLATALDARRLGLAARLLVDGCRPVDRQEGERALSRLREAGVELVREEQFSG
jgi:nicotinamidase-related amidase